MTYISILYMYGAHQELENIVTYELIISSSGSSLAKNNWHR